MNRKLVSLCILTVLLTFTISTLSKVQVVKASGTIYIRADGSVDPPTANITNLDNVTYTFTDNNYDSIVVERDNIVVDGAGYTVQGTGTGIGINMTGRSNSTLKNVEITNFDRGIILFYSSNNTITGINASSNNNLGIHLFLSSNNTIAGNTASSNNTTGIAVFSSSNNTLSGINASSNQGYGIYLMSSSNNTLVGNTASSNQGHGILLEWCSDNTLFGNTASNNQYNFGVSGTDFSHFNNYVDTSNMVDDKPIYYLTGVADAVYDAQTNVGAIYFINSDNITIRDLTLTKNDFGALFFNTTNSKIENVTASNNFYGISLLSSTNNVLSGNTASNNFNGIYLRSSNSNVLSSNTVSSNSFIGIWLSSSSDNTLFHNNLINNNAQGMATTGYVSTWDNGVEGNYYNNYAGVDLNHDGIGDASHTIDANNVDNYPLMGRFHSFNTSVGKSIHVISNSTVEGFEYESPRTIRFTVSNVTQNQTHGFCRVMIPNDALSPPYDVTVNGEDPTYVNYTLYENGTHSWIYFEYEHSTFEVVIIPEFPSLIILPPFIVATVLAAVLLKKKRRLR